jgi:hypothetical protein
METFVVRIWVPADSGAARAPDVLRGFVEHARSGGGASFSSGEALLASLGVLLEDGSRPEDSAIVGKPEDAGRAPEPRT